MFLDVDVVTEDVDRLVRLYISKGLHAFMEQAYGIAAQAFISVENFVQAEAFCDLAMNLARFKGRHHPHQARAMNVLNIENPPIAQNDRRKIRISSNFTSRLASFQAISTADESKIRLFVMMAHR